MYSLCSPPIARIFNSYIYTRPPISSVRCAFSVPHIRVICLHNSISLCHRYHICMHSIRIVHDTASNICYHYLYFSILFPLRRVRVYIVFLFLFSPSSCIALPPLSHLQPYYLSYKPIKNHIFIFSNCHLVC